jgi:putative alpha-1,2-mannosidase
MKHTESASRTLAYAYDDHAVSLVCAAMGDEVGARKYANRSQNYRSICESLPPDALAGFLD